MHDDSIRQNIYFIEFFSGSIKVAKHGENRLDFDEYSLKKQQFVNIL